jgi:hypothetical protein
MSADAVKYNNYDTNIYRGNDNYDAKSTFRQRDGLEGLVTLSGALHPRSDGSSTSNQRSAPT